MPVPPPKATTRGLSSRISGLADGDGAAPGKRPDPPGFSGCFCIDLPEDLQDPVLVRDGRDVAERFLVPTELGHFSDRRHVLVAVLRRGDDEKEERDGVSVHGIERYSAPRATKDPENPLEKAAILRVRDGEPPSDPGRRLPLLLEDGRGRAVGLRLVEAAEGHEMSEELADRPFLVPRLQVKNLH